VSIAEDREATLIARITQLTNDVDAQRKVIKRSQWERDQWRTRYLDLQDRVNRLYDLKETVREVSNGNA
jgi:uncharacterized protein (DUF2132 family)